ncbi:hypothetical protein [Pelomonas sp. KK5]|uniref:hypothetical protein n=1 Tax=Pelomonas sp. KK5 TaxID=1855730 RepID=UPI001301DBD4|nr:hypothetical protein [Pelomonas sp. KK5]
MKKSGIKVESARMERIALRRIKVGVEKRLSRQLGDDPHALRKRSAHQLLQF